MRAIAETTAYTEFSEELFMNDRLMSPSLVDMKGLLLAVLHRAWLIILAAIVCAVISYGCTAYLVTPRYESSVMFYVNNKSFEIGETTDSYKRDNIWVARDLVETYVIILYAGDTLDEVIEYAAMTGDIAELRDMLAVDIDDMLYTESVNDTEIFRVNVEGTDPYACERIANAIANVLPARIADIVDKTSAKVVEAAVLPTAHSWPNAKNNFVLGGMFGAVLGFGIIAMKEMFDTKIRKQEALEYYDEIPVLAAIPDLLSEDSAKKYGTYYYKKPGRKRKKRRI